MILKLTTIYIYLLKFTCVRYNPNINPNLMHIFGLIEIHWDAYIFNQNK
jgi:hypothetical protein